MPSKRNFGAKKQRQDPLSAAGAPLVSSSVPSASLAQTIRQLRLIVNGGRRKKIYRHHLFYRKAVHALFWLQKMLSLSPTLRDEQRKHSSSLPALNQASSPSVGSETRAGFVQAKTIEVLQQAGKAAAEEIAAQRIDTTAISSALLALFAVASQMVSRV